MTNDLKVAQMYQSYNEGLSLSEVGFMFDVTRQSVYSSFKRRGFRLRAKVQLPNQTFNGVTFSPQSNGYFRRTDGNRELMHRYVWRHYNGSIPKGYDIHHKDGNISNNKMGNLEIIRKDEHARRYGKKQNQYTKGR
jgi:hypothetical protein